MTSVRLIVLIPILGTLMAADRPYGPPYMTRSESIARDAMAATSHPLATQIALDILRKGGNAVDAAIAANAALGLMEPMSCGLGGDLFAIVWINRDRRLYGLNASGRAPAGLTLQDLRSRGLKSIPERGPLSVSVPGAVDGWFELHSRFGKLPMSEILNPTIRYARDGFPVSPVIAGYWQGGVRLGELYPEFAAVFLPGGRPPAAGEIFRNPALALSLESIGREGRDVFYRGELARQMEGYFRKSGTFLRYEDLAKHTSTWVDPVSTNYRGYDVWELPPNGQGIAVLQMLNLLEPLDLRSMGHNSARYLHHLVEAKKIAFEDRAKFYADPEFNRIPVEYLISKEYAEERGKQLDPRRAARKISAGDPIARHGDTIYLTVADSDRNMVSLIQSNFMGFGSGLVLEELGFCLQNRGSLFTLEEGQFNTYSPGKRPFHTIIPAFITKDGKPYLSFGVMGGDMQPQGHVQIICNLIDFGMSLQAAGDAPRFQHLGSSTPTGEGMVEGGTLTLESGVLEEVRRELRGMGHQIVYEPGGYGGYQAILYDAVNDVYWGATESRKDGIAAGF